MMRRGARAPRHATGPRPHAADTGRFELLMVVGGRRHAEAGSERQSHTAPIRATKGSMSSKLTRLSPLQSPFSHGHGCGQPAPPG